MIKEAAAKGLLVGRGYEECEGCGALRQQHPHTACPRQTAPPWTMLSRARSFLLTAVVSKGVGNSRPANSRFPAASGYGAQDRPLLSTGSHTAAIALSHHGTATTHGDRPEGPTAGMILSMRSTETIMVDAAFPCSGVRCRYCG